MSRCGFFASCAAVDTVSNPMYAKKTSPAPRSTPDQPNVPHSPAFGGMNGFQLVGLMCERLTTTTSSTIATLRITIRVLTRADSRMPITSTVDITSTMATAGRLMTAPVRLSPTWPHPAACAAT